MSDIHPTAIISDDAEIGDNAKIGPYCIVEGPARIGDNAVLHGQVFVTGQTNIGNNVEIFPFASIGTAPQDLKYAGEDTRLVIGDNCKIREGVTMNPGTQSGSVETRIGNNCVFLANSHVAHDCVLGDNVILSNGVLLAGHVQLGSFVIMGGGSAVHQFTRIGDHAFVGGLAGIENDVIPFGMALGNRAYLGGLNLIGMKRHNYPRESINAVRQAYKALFATDEGTLLSRVDALSPETVEDRLVSQLVNFIRGASDRAFCMPRNGRST